MLGEVPDLAREVRALRLAVEEVEPKKSTESGSEQDCTRHILAQYLVYKILFDTIYMEGGTVNSQTVSN